MSNISFMPSAIETDSKGLEQFLYAHDIRAKHTRKNELGKTAWSYPPTPEVRRVVQEWMDIMNRRNACWKKELIRND